MKNYKVYGNERTSLLLTATALAVYSDCDPLEIREFTAEDGSHTYEMVGIIDRGDMSEEDVIEALESMME